MTSTTAPSRRPSILGEANALLAAIPQAFPLLALRIALALPFYTSGLTKWDGWFSLSLGARYLFEQEFRLHLFGAAYPYPAPLPMAFVAGCLEIGLPILLVIGLGTRFAALGLFGMIAIIQLTVPDGWLNFHLPWAAMALTLVVFGGGVFSLDRLATALTGRRLAPWS